MKEEKNLLRQESSETNTFRHLIRGTDAIKITTMTALSTRDHETREHDSIKAAVTQLCIAGLVTMALIQRIYMKPSCLKTESLSLLLRIGVVAMDIASGVLILADPAGKHQMSIIGKALLGCSVFASRLAGDEGHKSEKENDLEAAHLMSANQKHYS